MSRISPAQSVFTLLLALVFFVVLAAAITPFYPGSAPSILTFLFAGSAMLATATASPPSIFVLTVSLFLFVGFVGKALFHFTFGVPLIEPTGEFTTQWDRALDFASSGLAGVTAATLTAKVFPSFLRIRQAHGTALVSNVVVAGLICVTSVGLVSYWVNYEFHILRIGFPLGVDIHPRLYALLSFTITWGAIFGALTLILWAIEIRNWGYQYLWYVAAALGFFAAVTMASRIQFLLYLLAATWVMVWRWRQVRSWWQVALAVCVAVVLFGAALLIVSLERTYDFVLSPGEKAAVVQAESAATATQSAESGRSNYDGVTLTEKAEAISAHRVTHLIGELKNLVVMRWIGLEGVMTTAAEPERLGASLFWAGLKEDPAAGAQSIYQKMSGDRYGRVEHFTFLTVPGPIGIGSYSGSQAVIFFLSLGLVLAGHALEWLAARLTGNLAAASVAGVSLAYLVVQMCFPWTLLIYAIELGLVIVAVSVTWSLVNRIRWAPGYTSAQRDASVEFRGAEAVVDQSSCLRQTRRLTKSV
ncbi:MAG: hypothetical protein GEV05_23205 [Betaproteobacteria bacterium]|nr:hypothetical protein [Betaproteobacteria bacterium]